MNTIKLTFVTLFFSCISVAGCQTEKNNTVLAVQGNYSLTKKHFDMYLAHVNTAFENQSKEEIEIEKLLLIEMFKTSPAEILASIEKINPIIQQPKPSQASHLNAINSVWGHQKVRDVLNGDIGQMQFDTSKANAFRTFVANSLLSSKSNSSSRGYGSSSYSESSATIQFCADGTFVESTSGYLSIDVPGMSALSDNSTDYMPGYWEVASLPNGMMVILLYSTHPLMLENSPNGLLPFIVGQYGDDFVNLPNGDGYRRSINYCN